MLICPLITRNTTDITTIQNFLSMLFKLGMMGSLMAIAGVVMCIAYSGRVAVVLAIAVPVMLIILVALLIAASRYSTGAGKTTLINLLMRFYEVNGGNIMIDGVSSTEMTRHELRTHFGMVLQDTWLFEGTIRDADVILYMENGDIKEVGDHDTLMEQNGKYALLYNSQFA